MRTRKYEQILREQSAEFEPDFDTRLNNPIDDDLLRLIFTACHPILPTDAQVTLALRLLGGLSTKEIARAFLQSESTIAQRIVRAKRALSKAQIPFELPQGDDMEQRLSAVLAVIYLIFNEGYSPASGNSWIRKDLYEEALRLGRTLASLMPAEPEVHGLVALMEIQASRSNARVALDNTPILLLDQDRSQWDHLLIHRGLSALGRAMSIATRRGPCVLQAAIAACHARALEASQTDWHRIASLYRELATITPSPVIELNRAVAVAMAEGPAAGLALTDPLTMEPALATYHLLPAVRGDLLSELGRHAEARTEFRRAADLAPTDREKKFLISRAVACEPGIIE